jgi:serine/threonine-protein kinase
MGIVLLAVREGEGFEQTVALKLIRGAFADPRLRERLESERRILARLEHPGIARLIDGGWTDERQPFFAMEYVPGEDILTYSDSRRLGVEERLSLFAEVCEAVHYAHQQLVVHRDLKPSNILVTAEGRPKLLDFGIAKGLEAAEGEGQTERWVTPAYASPEQVSAGVVSTLSDVYALGVLLCELLVGVKPYPISGATPSEISRVVAEVEPTRPSVLATRDPDGEGGGGPRDHVPISGVPHRLV